MIISFLYFQGCSAMAGTENGEGLQESLEESLFEAVRRNDTHTVSVLANMPGVDINRTNSAHKTPLYFALERENKPMIKLLLNNDADVNVASYCSAHCSFETPIVTAARIQRKDLVEILLNEGCELERVGSKEGKSALQWAATYGDIAMAKMLVSHGADVNWIGPYFHTALHYATLADKPDMVQWLLEHGADISINGDGRTSLHIGAVRGNLAIVKHLVKHKCEIDVRDNFNFTPFSLACLRGHFVIIKFLMDHAPVGTEFNMNDGLHRAAELGHLAVLKFLIDNGADVNSLNSLGESALSIASRGQYQSVQLLLENGARINSLDKRGYTPLQHSVLREQIDIATMLIQHGSYLHTYTNTVESPLQICCDISNPVLVKCLLDAGCQMSKEPWFNPQVIAVKVQELDYRSIRFHRQISFHKDLWLWIINKLKRPPTLLESSRISVRNQLSTATRGSSILQSIQNLTLPNPLKKYLALEDLLWV